MRPLLICQFRVGLRFELTFPAHSLHLIPLRFKSPKGVGILLDSYYITIAGGEGIKLRLRHAYRVVLFLILSVLFLTVQNAQSVH